MFTALLLFFITATALDVFLSAAVIYHLRRYTLPTWTAPKIVIPVYLMLALIFWGLAAYHFLQIQLALG